MSSLIFICLIAIVVVFIISNNARLRQRKKLEVLEARWGRIKSEQFNFNLIEGFYNVNTSPGFHTLTAQTKTDIDFYEIFTFVDRTVSRVGQQYLFDKLGKPTNDIQLLKKLSGQAEFFVNDTKARKNAQQQLLRLEDEDAYFVTSLLDNGLFKKPAWAKLLIIDIFSIFLILIASFYYHALLLLLMIPLALNLGLHFWNKNNGLQFIKSFPQLNTLIEVCKKLGGYGLPFEEKDALRSAASLKTFQSKRKLLSFGQSSAGGELDQLLFFFVDVLKAFFLVELFAFFSLMKELQDKRGDIITLFCFVGVIDMAMSIASLRSGEKSTCTPGFIPAAKKMELVKLYHPLIEDCITNNISVQSKSVLITGSNMSGKTTFLRTVAVNSLLAQTIYTCFAEKFEAPVVKLFSSIRIDDSLLEGKSFYFEEVNIMRDLINHVSGGNQSIFVLDEVFKGTNTIERIAAAKAILSYLNKQDNIVFVATHDIELAALLNEEYDLYHFSETIENGRLNFDHLLKYGPLKTRNAIKILELHNYPTEITAEAKRLSGRLSV